MKKLLMAICLPLLLATTTPAVGEFLKWSVHTDQSRVTAISAGESEVWVAGTGGVAQLDLATGEVTYFNSAVDEFHTNRFRDILLATTGDLWAASSGEGLLRHRPDVFPSWQRFQAYQGLASDRINCLLEGVDGTIWYGSDRGFGQMDGDSPGSVWAWDNGLIHEDVRSLALQGDTLLVGTQAGLYQLVPLGEGETVLVYDDLSPTDFIIEIAVLADSLWVLNQTGEGDNTVHRRAADGTAWVQLALPLGGYEVAAMTSSGDSLIVTLDEDGGNGRSDLIYSYQPTLGIWSDLSAGLQELNDRYPAYSSLTYDAIAMDGNGTIWLGGDIFSGLGPGLINNGGGSWSREPLAFGPMGGEMKAMRLGPSGRLWAMGTTAGASYQDAEWTHYPTDNNFASLPRFGLDVLEDSQGWVWFNRYLHAFGRFKPGVTDSQEVIEIDDVAYLCMVEDGEGYRYFGSDYGQGFDICDPGDNWYHDLFTGQTIDDLAVMDGNRIAVLSRGVGLVIWDHGGTPGTVSDDVDYTVSGGGIDDPQTYLKSDTFFSSLAFAPDGGLWVGQENGMAHLLPGTELNDPEYVVTEFIGQAANGVPGLIDPNVADLEVAPDGSVWVGSKFGLSHLRPRLEGGYDVDLWTTELGREILGEPAWLTQESISPLPDADVRQVALAANGKTIYAGTNNGLAAISLMTDPPLTGDLDLWLYPNPVKSSLGHESIYLGGSETDIAVKIFNLEGELVRDMGVIQPGDPVWDLTIRRGSQAERAPYAASGIYLARLESNGVVVTQQIVLIR